MRLFYLFLLALALSSCGFDKLTNIQNQDTTAPTAKECGSCHVDQYNEWVQSSHAQAFNSSEFREQTDYYNDQECLFCHIPGSVQDPKREPRSYNLDEGITCVSCHLHNKTMKGPHKSGALFTPHAIAQDPLLDSKLNSSQLCGICHQETFEQWTTQKQQVEIPSCLDCHGAQVERRHTKGTSFLSEMLVAFEPSHKVRSHQLFLSSQAASGIYPELKTNRLSNETILLTLSNNLPHDLPAGIYGEKHLIITLSKDNKTGKGESLLKTTKTITINTVLSPGESKNLTISFLAEANVQNLTIDLFRFHQSTQEADLIHSYHFVDSPLF